MNGAATHKSAPRAPPELVTSYAYSIGIEFCPNADNVGKKNNMSISFFIILLKIP